MSRGFRSTESEVPPARADSNVALAASPARILVIHTREELMIAREASRVARKRSEEIKSEVRSSRERSGAGPNS